MGDPIILSKQDIRRFQRLYSKHFSVDLDNDMAHKELASLVSQIELVYQPISLGQFDRVINKYVYEDGNNEQSKKLG